MNTIVREYLIRLAEKEDTSGYQNLCNKCGLNLQIAIDSDMQILSDILTTISESEHKAKRPLLSAVIYEKTKGMPGKGFFSMAAKLKKFDRNGNDIQNMEYFDKELEEVFAFWKKK